jgi:ribosomal protein S18 acetylase RimI-like enzyme
VKRQISKKPKGVLAAVGFARNRRVEKIENVRPVLRYERELIHTKRKGLVQKAEMTLHGDKYPYGRVQVITARGKEAARVGMIEKKVTSIGKIFEIWGIDTRKGWGKEGFATQLMSEAIHIAKQKKAKALELDTTIQNSNALSLYKRMGFVEVKRNVFKVKGKNYIQVRMRLLL